MDIILLVKYVADVEHVPADAWDLERGTLRRRRLTMVANPLDDRALAAGRAIARQSGGRLIALSMGPPSAERICRRAISFGADEALLLSDRAFAGADTLATARPLVQGIRRLVTDRALSTPLVFAGMQSPDGDTAQVPAEVAALLGAEFLPYALDWELSGGGLQIELMQRQGRGRYRLDRGPAVVTWTALSRRLPFATSLAGLHRGATAEVPVWGLRELGMSADQTGLAGSATRVRKIVSVPPGGGPAHQVVPTESDSLPRLAATLARWIVSRLGDSAGKAAATTGRAATAAADVPGVPTTPGASAAAAAPLPSPIWVYLDSADLQGGLELLGRAREIAGELGTEVHALLSGSPPDRKLLMRLGEHGAGRVLLFPGEWSLTEEALLFSAAVRTRRPRTVLIPASLRGRGLSALAAAELGAGLTADCTGLELEPPPGRKLLQTRPALGGNVRATITSTADLDAAPEMATVRSGVFPLRYFSRPAAELETLPTELPPDRRARVVAVSSAVGVRSHGAAAETGDTSGEERGATPAGGPAGTVGAPGGAGVDPEARVIVAVGIGIRSPERLEQFVRPLLEALRDRLGIPVSLACSRAAVDAGILPYEYQIGQTGKSVRPDLYIAVGISGAIQHRLGMEHAGGTVSINPDGDAPIHRVSDYAVIARLEDVLPELTRALGELPRIRPDTAPAPKEQHE